MARKWIFWVYYSQESDRHVIGRLRAAGKPFLAGNHGMDDPAWREHVNAYPRMPGRNLASLSRAAAVAAIQASRLPPGPAGASAKVATGITAPMWQRTEVPLPAAPAPGGHVDRSWLHYTRRRAAYRHDPPWPAVADKLLAEDPAAHLLLLFYAGHPDCLDLLAHLRAEWPGRYVLAFHKHRCLADGNAERESQPYEDLLWDAADIRLLTPHARADPLYRKFRLAHDLNYEEHLLQSCVMSNQEIDQLIAMAKAVPNQTAP